MRKHHPENERIKRRYVEYLKHAKQLSDATIDQAAAAISDFEAVTAYRDFRKFRIELAQKYKRDLGERTNSKTGKPLSKATTTSRLMALKAFFEWLSGQPGFRSKLTCADAQYFRPSANDQRIARAVRDKPVASVPEILQVIASMPYETDVEKRDRALVAFTLLTGARDDAVASMCLKNVNLDRHTVVQDARNVRTKNRKTFTTCFFPVDGEAEEIVRRWFAFLTTERGWRLDDPLFPKTKVVVGPNGTFEAKGLEREHWKDAAPIRRIFRNAFARAGLPYRNPHSVRDTLARLGETLCSSAETFKAWSQNLGHADVLTTFMSYGKVPGARQVEIFENLRIGQGTVSAADDDLSPDLIAKVVARLSRPV